MAPPAHPSNATLLGTWCVTPSPFTVELLAAEGFDFLCIDCQHGLIGADAMWPMLLAMRWSATMPIVRVPANDAAWIGKALDAGAAGVIVPMVNTVDEAVRAVSACRYPPAGVRSFGPTRSRLLTGERSAEVDARIAVFAMIETEQAFAVVDDIAAVPGLDGLYVGPADLALSMGVPLTDMLTGPVSRAAFDRIVGVAGRHGLTVGIHTPSADAAIEMAARGFGMCSISNDARLLRASAGSELAAARARALPVSAANSGVST